MGKTLYLECNSGISGDMMVAALLDLGANQEKLLAGLNSLPVAGYTIDIKRVLKAGLDVCDFDVVLDKEHENHDHDMEYLYGHSSEQVEQDHQEKQDLPKGHDHHHAHEHRNLSDVKEIIYNAEISEEDKALAIKIFTILANAEAKAHGVSLEKVHFHEVGAVDSIADIVAVAVCFHDLDISKVIVKEVSEGTGSVRCQHGRLPVPVPAVTNIAAKYEIPLHITDTQGELVTPTGAAILAAICTDRKLPETFTIEKIGLGAGKRSYDRPSILRAIIINPTNIEEDSIYKLESNIDDCTGEMLGYTMECLLKAGARDVNYMPVYMKKNRPAYQLNVICTEQDITKMEMIIFRETTTIGIRRVRMERTILQRKILEIDTDFGKAKIKKCTIGTQNRYYPEYESVVQICQKSGKSFEEAYQLLQKLVTR